MAFSDAFGVDSQRKRCVGVSVQPGSITQAGRIRNRPSCTIRNLLFLRVVTLVWMYVFSFRSGCLHFRLKRLSLYNRSVIVPAAGL